MRTRASAAAILSVALTSLALAAPAAHATAAAAPYDFNGDGRADLAIGAPGATVGGKAKAGAVSVVYGSASGPKSSTYRLITQNTAGVPGTAEADDAFGTAVASADLNTDGYADLIVGAPGEDTDDDTNNGTVAVVWGSASGLSGARTLPDFSSRDHDHFGQSLAAADLDGDGDQDVAVGSTDLIGLNFVDGPITKSAALSYGSGSGFSWASSYGILPLRRGRDRNRHRQARRARTRLRHRRRGHRPGRRHDRQLHRLASGVARRLCVGRRRHRRRRPRGHRGRQRPGDLRRPVGRQGRQGHRRLRRPGRRRHPARPLGRHPGHPRRARHRRVG